MKARLITSALAGVVLAQDVVTYNGNIQYFIADLATTSPCHPLYERAYTWVDTTNNDSIDYILNALVRAGFNGIRLPMWPESDLVLGPDPTNEARDISRQFCDSMNEAWVSRIRTATDDATYKGFYIYFSPAFDNRLFQEELSKEEYAAWILSYTSANYSPQFISPFSSNESDLKLKGIDDLSQMSDLQTMWELDLLRTLKASDGWGNLSDLVKPQIIGPDRGSVLHTRNVLESFSGSALYIRPDYKAEVDIVGSQARYPDHTATDINWKALSADGLEPAWCTMCSQEWYRQIDTPLGYSNARLRGSRTETGYWSKYAQYWGSAQAPASQALNGGVQGFVAEAAVPRFVSKQGQDNIDRDWTVFDKMVNIDNDPQSYDLFTSTENRSSLKPLQGFRRSLSQLVDTKRCPEYGDEDIDRVLAGYDSCSFELTEKDFAANNYAPILLYVDSARSVLAFIETCKTTGQQLCDTQEFQVGTDYSMNYAADWAVRMIFENEEPEPAIFQIEFASETGTPLVANHLAAATLALVASCTSLLL